MSTSPQINVTKKEETYLSNRNVRNPIILDEDCIRRHWDVKDLHEFVDDGGLDVYVNQLKEWNQS